MEVGSQRIKTSFKANQLLTGHGNMESNLARFKLKQTDGNCECGMGGETVQHIKYDCQLERRVTARARISMVIWTFSLESTDWYQGTRLRR